MHPVEAYIRERIDPPQAEIDWLIGKMKLVTLQKGQLFCEMGQIAQDMGLLVKGQMRYFTLSEGGEDTTVDFVFPVGVVVALAAAIDRKPSEISIEALEDSELYVCPFNVRDELIATGDRSWMKLILMETEDAFRRKTRFAASLQLKDAEARYREAMVQFRPRVAKIRQYHLASYLGILPQSLSRIRARLGRKKVLMQLPARIRARLRRRKELMQLSERVARQEED